MVDVMTHAQVPARTHEQRMDALRSANVIRTNRALLKKRLKRRELGLVDVLLAPPQWLETAKIGDLLLALPSVGEVKRNKILRDIEISPSKTVGGMTQRQRAELLQRLRS